MFLSHMHELYPMEVSNDVDTITYCNGKARMQHHLF